MDFFETSAFTSYNINEVNCLIVLLSYGMLVLVLLWFHCNWINVELVLLCASQAFSRMTSLVLEANGKDLGSELSSNNDDLRTPERDLEHEYPTCLC